MLALALSIAGCGGGGGHLGSHVSGHTLTVYASAPRHGASAAAGEAALTGARQALQEAGGRAGGRRVRLVEMSSTKPGDLLWDPGIVEANADRAAADPTAIAYLGELDLGGSAVSLPATNRAGLLQVSPADGLASLTATPPGGPRAGPGRYYPKGVRSFVRLVPSDLELSRVLLRLARERGALRPAVLYTEGIAERELAGTLSTRLRMAGRAAPLVDRVRDDPGAVQGLVEKLAATGPRAVIFAGVRGRAASTLLAALARRLPDVPVLCSAPLAAPGVRGPMPETVEALTGVIPAAGQPARARRLLARLESGQSVPERPEAIYGYEAMRLVLDAIDSGGPDRRRVVRAALSSRSRSSVSGRYEVLRTGDVSGRPLAVVELRGGRAAFLRLVR